MWEKESEMKENVEYIIDLRAPLKVNTETITFNCKLYYKESLN